jgi:CRISPR-associated protein Cas5/CasD subtype I-E
MSALLLRLAGPLQSWGYRSRFSDRDTGLEPTKSGVVGLLCCALGRPRAVSPADLAALRMHVRVDRQGTLLKDFHTAGGGIFRGCREYFAPTSSGTKGKNPVVTERHYLQDASFAVALEGDDDFLSNLEKQLQWPGNRLQPGFKWVRFPPASLTANCRFGLHLLNVASEPFSSLAVSLKSDFGCGGCRLEYICCRFESDHPPCHLNGGCSSTVEQCV